ncbi:MAG: Ig-like domain-containing protein [Gammaproteobacteria bacterium]
MQRSTLLSSWVRTGAMLAALAIAGCGGGGSDDTILVPPGDGDDGGTGAVTQVTLSTSSAQLPTSGNASATITAVVQDSNNVVVPGATVNFTSDSGVLSAGSVTTDAGGAAQTVIGAGGDSTPRTITVTATSEGVSNSIDVSLVNAQLTINGPTEVFVNVITEYVVQLSDESGNPIAGQTVTLDSIAGNELDFRQRTTNSQGQATFRYTASEFGQDELVATGFGETTSLDIEIGIDIATIGLFTSTPTLGSDGVERADITAIVQDSGGRVVSGALVSISADTGDIAQSDPQTDPNGRVEATLGTAGNPTNRVITVTATAGFAEQTVTVEVKGTRIELSGPTNVVLNDQVQYVARLLDSGDNGVAGEAVEFVSTSNTLSAASVVTDSTGEATVTLTATTIGDDTLTATALGEVADVALNVSQDAFAFVAPAADTEIPLGVNTGVTVEWLVDGAPQTGQTVNIFTTRGTLSANSVVLDGNGRGTVQISSASSGRALLTAVNSGGSQISRSVEFVATTPASLDLQASRFIVAPGEQSTIRATVRDASGNLVKNQFIEFILDDVTGGVLSSGGDITNSNGQAETTYTAGSTVGASGAVTITANVVNNPAVTDAVELTVAGQEVFISLGTGNTLFEPDPTTYQQPWTVLVTDVEGVGVAGAPVDVSVLSLQYIKGQYVADPLNNRWAAQEANRCFDEDTKFCSGFQEPNGDPRCRNGRLDPEEDDPLIANPTGPQQVGGIGNNSGFLEAGNVAALSSGQLVTNDAGRADFRITYGQKFGNWVKVRLRVRTAVAGTEFSETAEFVLPVTVDDVELDIDPPGGIASTWGIGASCQDTN